MKLVDGWRKAYKWFSVNCMVLAGAVQATWMSIPDDIRTAMPHNIIHFLTIALLALGVIGRLVQQQ